MENRRKIGSDYENLAADFLREKGYRIIARNFRDRTGEIDIIAKDADYLVFVEVKYRTDETCGNPLEAVDAKKQRRICRTAFYYCMKYGYGDTVPCRFDVIGIDGEKNIVHIVNAFEFQY